MSMFTLSGRLMNVYKNPDRTADDGGIKEGAHKIQLMGNVPVMGTSETRLELVNLTCHDPQLFDGLNDKEISIPVGVFAPAKGTIIYYIPKGQKPQVIGTSAAPQNGSAVPSFIK